MSKKKIIVSTSALLLTAVTIYFFPYLKAQLVLRYLQYRFENIIFDQSILPVRYNNTLYKENYTKIENIKIISGSYDVVVSSKLYSKFTNQKHNLSYWIALEPDSTFNE